MESVNIIKRELKDKEISLLINEIRGFSAPFYVKYKVWKSFKNNYILLINNKFAGVFVINIYKDWIKLGPFVLLKEFQGKGFGTKIFKLILRDYKKDKLFIVTPSLAVKKIVKKLQFNQVKNYFSLPLQIKIFLIIQLASYLNLTFIKEFIRKTIFLKREKPEYFIKN